MAQLTRTAGQSLSLSEVRAFFDGKFDPATAGVDGSSLSHYLRDGGIVRSVSDGGGFTDFYTNTPHSRFGRGFNGADGTTNSASHTWGIYSNTVDLTTNPTGINPESTALTMGGEYRLVFNIRNEDGTDISADYLAFLTGDRLRFERNTGTFAGNGYVFELTNDAVSNNDDGQGDNPVVITMGATVIEIIGTGLIDDQLGTSPDRDTLTASRASVETPVYPDTGGFAIENAGTFEARSTDSTNWATSAEGVTVFGMPGIEYSIGGSGSFEGGGRFRNNTGNTITVQGNLRLRFTASNFRGDSTATITPFFWNEESTFVQGTFTRPADPNGSVSGEIIINPTAAQSTQWVQGGFLDFIYFDNQGDRPYDVTIDSVRVRFQGTEEFAPTGTTGGGGQPINQDVPTSSPLSLSQLRNVDDGRTP